MLSTDVTPPYETSEIGTPRDYTPDLYRFYFELGRVTPEIEALFVSYSQEPVVLLSYGIEATFPIQIVPDLIRELISENEAIYQVIRYAKIITIPKESK